MSSSFARRLFVSAPDTFRIRFELVVSEHSPDNRSPRFRHGEFDVDFSSEEYTDDVLPRVADAIQTAKDGMTIEYCSVDLSEEPIPNAASFPAPSCRVALTVNRAIPFLHSIELSRTSSSGNADETLLVEILSSVDTSCLRRLKAGPGFSFFITRKIPASKFPVLRHLNLAHSGLFDLPETIGELDSIETLRLSHNKLTKLPKGLGRLVQMRVLVLDHNQLVAIPGELCECTALEELNLESNKLITPMLDLAKLPKLRSLQLHDNPLTYLPELKVCTELRSLSLPNFRVWSDSQFSKFEVDIGGTSVLARGSKLGPLFTFVFRRSQGQHPLLAGALGRIAESPENCQAIVREQGAIPQLIYMALSDSEVVQEEATKVIGYLAADSLGAEELVRSDVVSPMLTLMDSPNQNIQSEAIGVLASLSLASDTIASTLLTPKLLEKVQGLIQNTEFPRVRHLALGMLGNLSFSQENKSKLLGVSGLKDMIVDLARGTKLTGDRKTCVCARRALAILGEYEEVGRIVGRAPVRSRGIRILAMDGGGMKGIATVRMLRQLEERTGQRIFDLFDLIGGTSTGAMLAVAMGILNKSLDQCDDIYKKLGYKVFNQPLTEDQSSWKESLARMYRSGQQSMRIAMTGCKHDASTFEHLLQDLCQFPEEHCLGASMIDTACLPCPKVFTVATLSSLVPAVPFLFRNYELPPGSAKLAREVKACVGSSKHQVWQAIRSSSAAPYYLDDYQIGGWRFQDGATTANNPAAIAIQQARLLWPDRPIDCLVSFGVGTVPVTKREKSTSTILDNGSVLLESACSVERVDEVLSTVLPMVPGLRYFRFSPIDPRCDMGLDTVELDAWEKLEAATDEYLERQNDRLQEVAGILLSGFETQRPSKTPDAVKETKLGSRRGMLVVEAPHPAHGWVEDVTKLCGAFSSAVARVDLGLDNASVRFAGSERCLSPTLNHLREVSLDDWNCGPTGRVEEASVPDADRSSPSVNGIGHANGVVDEARLADGKIPQDVGSPKNDQHMETPFKAWHPDVATSMFPSCVQRLQSGLSEYVEEVGIVHLGLHSLPNGDQLVGAWEVELLAVAEPGVDADNLLAEWSQGGSYASLGHLLSVSPRFNVGDCCYQLLSRQETQLMGFGPVASYTIQKCKPHELISPSHIRTMSMAWKGMIVVSMCWMGESLVNAFLGSGVRAVVLPVKDAEELASRPCLEMFKSFYKKLAGGLSVVTALERATSAAPELQGRFEVKLP